MAICGARDHRKPHHHPERDPPPSRPARSPRRRGPGHPDDAAGRRRRGDHVRRRAPPRGHAGGPRDPGRGRHQGHVLPRRRAGRAPAGAGGTDRRAGPSGRAPRISPPAPAADAPEIGATRSGARSGRRRGGDRGRTGLAPASVWPLQRRRPALRSARTDLKPLLWSRWGKDWRRLTTPERIADPGDRQRRAPAT